MTGITYIQRITGSTNNLVYLETTDTTATATASGYITAQTPTITSLNEGAWTWETNDCIMLSASDGISWCSINSTFTTLTSFAGVGSGDVTYTSPSVANSIPVFTNTTGNIADSSHSINGNFFIGTASNAITAHAGGGQTNATLLTADIINNVTTVATAADSVKLPASVAGLEVTVANNGANAMQVFGSGTDTINSVATATGVSQNAGTVVTYRSNVTGNWLAVLPPLASAVMLTNATNTMGAGSAVILDKSTGTISAGAVTLNKQSGVLTTPSLTTASGSSYSVTLTNSEIATTSVILCQIQGGTNTTPGITIIATPGSGSATILLENSGVAAAALNGTVIFSFVVF